MSDHFGNTMTTSSSSEMYAHSFMASQDEASEGTAGSQPVITQQDQVASVSYRPGDVAKPNQTQGEVSVALPIFTPKGTMDFRLWATQGYSADGDNIGPAEVGQKDYDHEPSLKEVNYLANR